MPIDISNSGSLAATTVNCESPVIEKVPMDAVIGNDPASAIDPIDPLVAVKPNPVGVMFTSAVATDVPTDDVRALPVNAYSDSNILWQ